MKKPVHLGLLLVTLAGLVFFLSIQLSCSDQTDSNVTHEEREKTTGVEKQLAMWFFSRAYPEPGYLNAKFMAAWQHAKAMRTPDIKRENEQGRLNFGGWASLNGPSVGRVLCIAIHPTTTSTVFIGSASGGIWKTTNGGSNWSFVPTNLPVLGVASIAFHPSNGNILLAGTGEVYRVDTSNIGFNVWKARGTYGIGIIRSTDGGTTWTQVMNKNTAELFGIQMIKFDPTDPNIVYACTTHGLFKSTDAGATWGATAILDKIYVSDVVINSSNNQQMMAAVGNLVNGDKGIYRTTDGGSSWNKVVSAAIPTSFNGYSRFAYLSGNTVYISMGRTDGGTSQAELFRSTNFGSTWNAQSNSHHCEFQYWFANTAAILPSRPDSIFMGGVSFYRHRVSTQARTTIGSSMHSDFHDIKFDPSNSSTAYIACDGGMYKTTNATASSPTFSQINNGLNISQFYASFGVSATTADRYVGGLQDNGVWSWNGSSWASEFGGDGGPSAVDPTNANIVYASNDARSVRKSTSGVTGTYSSVLSSWAFVGDDRTAFMAPIAISPSTPTTLYVASDNLHRSTNSGSSWTNNSGTISSNTNYIEAQFKTAIALAVSPTDANKLYVSLSNLSQRVDDGLNVTGQPSVRKSVNGGTSFTSANGSGNDTLPKRFILDFAISPTNDDSVFVTVGGFRPAGETHIYVTGNGGTTWTKLGATLPDIPFNAIVFDPLNSNIIYAGCDLGVYVSPNRGGTWYDFNTGMATTDPVQVFDLQISADNKIVAATHGRGVYRSDLFNLSLLPVTLQEFTGAHDRGYNKLNWQVEGEASMLQYELERSINAGAYTRIATVPARNLNSQDSYTWDDPVNTRQSNNYYYRLKMVNLDGSFTYSSVVPIKITSPHAFDVLENPVKDRIRIQVSLGENQVVQARLYDSKGRLLKQQLFQGLTGNNLFTIEGLSVYPAGMYILEAVIGRERYTQKIIRN